MGSGSRWWPFAALFKETKPATGKSTARSTGSGASARSANPWHAVSIVPGTGACGAARRFKGVRFLSKDAPRLPLPACAAPHCTCRFKHHDDRRAGPRRRSEQGMISAPYSGSERRRTGGRRWDDR
jgi:hypothetical protein